MDAPSPASLLAIAKPILIEMSFERVTIGNDLSHPSVDAVITATFPLSFFDIFLEQSVDVVTKLCLNIVFIYCLDNDCEIVGFVL